MVKILQTNLGKARAAHDLAYAKCKKEQLDLLIVAEPNKAKIKGKTWIQDKRQDVAMLILNRTLEVVSTKEMEGYIVVNFKKSTLVCCHISLNIGIIEYKAKVDEIMREIDYKNNVMVLGDFNAKSPAWGSTVEDARGEHWTEWFAAKNMTVLNDGMPTFCRGASQTCIDVTAVTSKMAEDISSWSVLQEGNLSLHKYILVETKNLMKPIWKGGKQKKLINWPRYRYQVRARVLEMSQQGKTSHYKSFEILKDAYRMANITSRAPDRPIPYWWNVDIEEQRRRCNIARRIYTRSAKQERNPARLGEVQEQYRQARRELKRLINKSKRDHWNQLCDELDNDV
ncbi:uncharacterized protein [Leptinotarsa decemlineata]|uniref:uncharacterized protein n=1 Tax=Leptinotarsa decemlineata TaxID=7539 RepID=UPI003D30A1D2